MKRRTIAVDFDGTIVEHKFPEIGAVKQNVVDKVKEWHKQGHIIIIWTCRTDEYLDEAVKFINEIGLPYHAINENYGNTIGNCRKVLANIYLDDRALNVDDIDNFNIDSMDFDSDDILEDIRTLVCKINELSLHTVDPKLDEIKKIAKKYDL